GGEGGGEGGGRGGEGGREVGGGGQGGGEAAPERLQLLDREQRGAEREEPGRDQAGGHGPTIPGFSPTPAGLVMLDPTMAEAGPGQEQDIFRREALEHHVRPRREGDLLRLTPGWTRATFWLLVAVVVGGLAYALLGRGSEYASGPAGVRVAGKVAGAAQIQR